MTVRPYKCQGPVRLEIGGEVIESVPGCELEFTFVADPIEKIIEDERARLKSLHVKLGGREHWGAHIFRAHMRHIFNPGGLTVELYMRQLRRIREMSEYCRRIVEENLPEGMTYNDVVSQFKVEINE